MARGTHYNPAMPGYQSHLAAASAVAAVGAVVLWSRGTIREPAVLAGMAGACLAGGLLPDIDTDSKAQRLYSLVLLLLDAWLLWEKRYAPAAWLGLAAILPGLTHHRGLTHHWAVLLLLPGALLLVPSLALGMDWRAAVPYAAALAAGLFSHLLLDRL